MKRLLVLLGVLLVFSLADRCIGQSSDPAVNVQGTLAAPHLVRTIATLGGSPKQCAFAVEPLIQELRSMPYPADWNFLLVCTDAEWEMILRMADIRNTDTAFTVLPKRTTILRAKMFIHPLERGYKNTLWHELGHIRCNCVSEDRASKYAYDNK